MQINIKKQKGFTIIELVVVMAIFLFIIGAAIGIFISIVQQQKKVLAEQQILNQISYVEEYMSKALRMAVIAEDSNCIPEGYIYLLTKYNTNSGFYRGIKFINQSDSSACQEFFIDNTDPQHLILKELKNSNDDSDAVALTATGLQINFAKFSINRSNGSTFVSDSCQTNSQCGASDQDDAQPRATILMNVQIAGDNQTRTIQTTVSQRNLNVK